MAKEICISSTPHETRLAILEDDQLAEIYYERENEYTLAGSIYNGRVTRVLPGMQSAFVDIGLERDAFLYVTDFLELEDPEEADELEKAAASGGNTPPREVRHTAPAQPEDRSQRAPQKSEQKPEQKQEARPEVKTDVKPDARSARPARGRMTVEAAPVEDETFVAAPAVVPNSADAAEDEANETGARRWRGRRRRRSGRGGERSSENTSESQTEIVEFSSEPTQEALTELEVAPQIQASAAPMPVAPRPERFSTPVPFVMPGESLSKYGGTPAADSASPASNAPAAPTRPASSFKPATLIESPILWDGSGLMPGESLSRHRNRQPEVTPAVEVDAEPRGVFSNANAAPVVEPVVAPALVEEEFLLQESVEFAAEAVAEPFVEAVPEASSYEELTEEDLFEEEILEEDEDMDGEEDDDRDDDSTLEDEEEDQAFEAETDEPAPDATASHNIDPVPPTGFRLFGIGSKKKKEEEKPSVAPSSASDEFLIEEEEMVAPRSQRPGRVPAKGPAKINDMSDFEAAMLKGRIPLQEGGFDEDDEDEGSEAQPSPDSQNQRRDRNSRNDRGGRAGRTRPGQPTQSAAPSNARRGNGPTRRSSQLSDLPVISDLLKPGQEILVQIAKEPIAKKGARITSHIALPGRFLVFMPTVSHVGVSRKIESDEERQRLKRILISERGEASGGFIVRTAAEDASEEDLRADLRFLLHLWNEIKTRSDSSKSPALIYHDLSLIERILRDQVSSNFSNIWVDTQDDYERIVRFLNRFSPTLVRRVKLYNKEVPLFEHFGIQDEISKALRAKVWLKSGGSIVINQTEALVAIDINTGKYVGKSARLEDTIVKTNLDAVPEIVRQIRLRDLGGIIIIDFIDMDDRKNRFRVMAALEEALKTDRAPTKVLQFNDFGLVAITRKRVKQSLERTLSVPCPTCQATGMVKSPATVCNEIYTELRKMKKHFEAEDVMLRVHPDTVKVLKANNGSWITEFEELVEKNILIKSDPAIHPEQFDIQG
jgi:ribonuclease G